MEKKENNQGGDRNEPGEPSDSGGVVLLFGRDRGAFADKPMRDAVSGQTGKAKQHRQNEVVRHRWNDPQHFGQAADVDEAVIVVIVPTVRAAIVVVPMRGVAFIIITIITTTKRSRQSCPSFFNPLIIIIIVRIIILKITASS